MRALGRCMQSPAAPPSDDGPNDLRACERNLPDQVYQSVDLIHGRLQFVGVMMAGPTEAVPGNLRRPPNLAVSDFPQKDQLGPHAGPLQTADQLITPAGDHLLQRLPGNDGSRPGSAATGHRHGAVQEFFRQTDQVGRIRPSRHVTARKSLTAERTARTSSTCSPEIPVCTPRLQIVKASDRRDEPLSHDAIEASRSRCNANAKRCFSFGAATALANLDDDCDLLREIYETVDRIIEW